MPAMPLPALRHAAAAVGDRWTLQVVAALLEGPQRFGDVQAAVPGIAPNVLTDRLRRLERARLAVAQPYSTRPPRVVYELTDAGRDLAGALRLLADWGARHGADEDAEPTRHAECGTPLEAVWWCPTCEERVAGDDADELHFA
jgi:DNA-binding HxlR family transcriptional regulator